MKTKPIILLLILIQFSCKAQNSELDQSWILVEQRRKPNSGWMQQLSGLLVSFDGDSIKYSYITSKIETEKTFTIEDQYIKIDTLTFGRIIHLSKDSLIIEADSNSYDMHFRPLEEVSFNAIEHQEIQQKLTNDSWNLEDDHSFQRFYCDTAFYGILPKDKNEMKCVIYEQSTKDWKGISDYEWWTLKRFEGKLIFGYSYGQTENSFFQILDHTEDTLSGKYLSPFEENWMERKLIKQKSLSTKQLNNLKEMIIGKWEVAKFIEPNISKIDSIEENANQSGAGPFRYQGRISKTDIKENNIRLEFSENGKFELSANGKEVRKGDFWRITNDGCYIRIGAGLGGDDFIKIISLAKDSMQIQKKELIDSENNRGFEYFETFLNISMVKRK